MIFKRKFVFFSGAPKEPVAMSKEPNTMKGVSELRLLQTRPRSSAERTNKEHRVRVVGAYQLAHHLLRCVERSDGAELKSEKSEPQPVPGTPGVPGFRNPAAAQPQRWFRR